ncbi:MAG: TetR family transcriptional regulator [Ilumatobacter sp.]
MTLEQTASDEPKVGYPRKRRQTRRRLVEAGTRVIAERGPGHVSAADVAAEADVAVGTFYNHFNSVDALIDAVAHELGRGIEIGRDTLAEIEHDPSRRVTLGVLQLLEMADTAPAAAAAFVGLAAVRPEFRGRLRSLVDHAIRDGVADGTFDVQPGQAATNAVLGTTLQSMRSRILGESGPDEVPDVARLVLRVLGTDADMIEQIVTDAVAVAAPG